MNLAAAINYLDALFDILNGQFFENKLEKPVITVQSNNRKNRKGWCSTKKVWANDGTKKYEVNISAEYMNSSKSDLIEILLHEMVHLFNAMQGIQDTSNNGFYHNKQFKEAAEQHGLIANVDPKYNGYGWTCLSDEAAEFVEQMTVHDFRLVRSENADSEEEKEESKKSNSIKYVCPKCKAIARATKELNLVCGDCRMRMSIEDDLTGRGKAKQVIQLPGQTNIFDYGA